MKKMFFRMPAVAALLTCVFAFSSCLGDSDDETFNVDSNILGTWVTSATTSDMGTYVMVGFSSTGYTQSLMYLVQGTGVIDSETGDIIPENIEVMDRQVGVGNYTALNGKITSTSGSSSMSGDYTISNTTIGGISAKELKITYGNAVDLYYQAPEIEAEFAQLEEIYQNWLKK